MIFKFTGHSLVHKYFEFNRSVSSAECPCSFWFIERKNWRNIWVFYVKPTVILGWNCAFHFCGCFGSGRSGHFSSRPNSTKSTQQPDAKIILRFLMQFRSTVVLVLKYWEKYRQIFVLKSQSSISKFENKI